MEIRGFGSFGGRMRPPRTGRNPATGDPVSVPAKRVPYFKPSKALIIEQRQRPRCTLEQILAQCDPAIPRSIDRERDLLPDVGRERV